MADIRHDHVAKAPALQVFGLNRWIERDADPVSNQAPFPEFDVLDARNRIVGVKAAAGEKDRAADGSAAGPKGRSVLFARMMNKTVQEVAETGDRAGSIRIVIVRPENSPEFGIVLKAADCSRDGVLIDANVGVLKKKTMSPVAAMAPRLRPAAGPRRTGTRNTRAPNSVARCTEVSVRAVIDHNQLSKLAPVPRETRQTLPESFATVVNRDNDRNREGLRHS